MSKTAFVFPGQGSQQVGMLADLAEQESVITETFQEASDALGYDLWALVQNGPEAELNKTEKTQPALLAAGVALWRLWLQKGGEKPAYMAGHSLGEYTALVCAGALPFTDAIKLVENRGKYMQSAVPLGTGSMAAIIGLDDDQVRLACEQAADGDVVEAVNFNSPGQVVIAGQKEAVERAMAVAKELGAKRALPLSVSAPSHCALMKPAAEQLALDLAKVNIETPEIPVVHNVSGSTEQDPEKIRALLVEQLFKPVLWVDCVKYLVEQGVSGTVECGPGKVLSGLNRRIDKSLSAVALGDQAGLEAALAQGDS